MGRESESQLSRFGLVSHSIVYPVHLPLLLVESHERPHLFLEKEMTLLVSFFPVRMDSLRDTTALVL